MVWRVVQSHANTCGLFSHKYRFKSQNTRNMYINTKYIPYVIWKSELGLNYMYNSKKSPSVYDRSAILGYIYILLDSFQYIIITEKIMILKMKVFWTSLSYIKHNCSLIIATSVQIKGKDSGVIPNCIKCNCKIFKCLFHVNKERLSFDQNFFRIFKLSIHIYPNDWGNSEQ